MTQKFFYVVDHYLPFPVSEYGGMWNVIAKDDNECFDLITEEDSDNFYESYYPQLRENILKAYTYTLAEENLDSCIVDQFTT